jgi:hypothetical protein
MGEQCCCGQSAQVQNEPTCEQYADEQEWVSRYKETSVGTVPIIATTLSHKDIVNGWKVRWGIRRMNYKVRHGLYGIGNPDEHSPVLVTANYKLTFDKFRKELTELNAWILVLDTKGVNVWCAAGKGTFGTEELLRRIQAVNLADLVNHRTLILPQLGATGVAAHEVRKASGFKVIYGPVRASDIRVFLAQDLQKSEEMRNIEFPLKDRLAVIPVELVMGLKPIALLFVAYFLVRLLKTQRLDLPAILTNFLPYLGAVLVGSAVVPILLPYIPTRSFALKGAIMGGLWGVLISLIAHSSLQGSIAAVLVFGSIASFVSLNFTGSTTFTSLSGVQLETKAAIPILLVCVVVGILLG